MHEGTDFKQHEKNAYFDKMRKEYKKGDIDKDIQKPKSMDMFKHVLSILPSSWKQSNVIDIDRKSKLPVKEHENP